jgi:hypothetical protein
MFASPEAIARIKNQTPDDVARAKLGAGQILNSPAMPPQNDWSSLPDPGGAAPATPTAPGAPTAGMSPDQVRQYVTNFFASKGVTPNPTSIDYWTQKYSSPEFNGDFKYWGDRLAQADEFTGGGGQQGGGATGQLGGMIGGGGQGMTPEQVMQQDPGYGFRLGEGLKGMERGAAAKGTLLTGGTQKALQRYAQDYASGEFGNVFNRNLALGQLGLGAASQAGAFGSNYANQQGNLLTGNADAQGAGSIAQGNIWGQLPSTLAGLYDFYKKPSTGGGTDPFSGVPGGFGTAGTSF